MIHGITINYPEQNEVIAEYSVEVTGAYTWDDNCLDYTPYLFIKKDSDYFPQSEVKYDAGLWSGNISLGIVGEHQILVAKLNTTALAWMSYYKRVCKVTHDFIALRLDEPPPGINFVRGIDVVFEPAAKFGKGEYYANNKN